MVPIDKILERFGVIGKWISIAITFHLVCFGWILFRAKTSMFVPLMKTIGELFVSSNHSLFYLYGRGVFFLGAIVIVTDYLAYRKDVEFPDLLRKVNPYVAAHIATACYFGIVLLGRRESAQFIYFQF